MANNGDPATPKQVALLAYMGYSTNLTKADASKLISIFSDESANQAEWEKLQAWSTVRHYLHPNLYPDGLAEIKARRADAIYSMNNEDRGMGCPLKQITKAKAKEIVAWLDAKSPGWDASIWGAFGTITPDAFHDLIIPAAADMDPSLLKRGYGAIPDKRSEKRSILPPLPPVRHDPSKLLRPKQPSQFRQAGVLVAFALSAAILILWALSQWLKK